MEMETCVLIPRQNTSGVLLNSLEITMPASKKDLGFELGQLIFMIAEYGEVLLSLPTMLGIEQPRGISMIARATIIINQNPDIVVRVINRDENL